MENNAEETVSALTFIDQQMEIYADCDASLKEINSAMDKEILEIRKKYAESITHLQQKKELAFNQVEAFAVAHQALLFSIKRSFKTKLGTFGFRTGKPRFTLTGNSTWAKITDLLKEVLPNYVRIAYEPCKDKLMADFTLPHVQKLVPAMGLEITQDETFYIDLKK
jgi:phage host-nuclease inhibitor protein Gam